MKPKPATPALPKAKSAGALAAKATEMHAARLAADITAREAEAAKKRARGAKVKSKSAKKAWRQARKAAKRAAKRAKQARETLAALTKKLKPSKRKAATKSVIRRGKPSTKPAAKKKIARRKPATAAPTSLPATAPGAALAPARPASSGGDPAA